MRLFNRAKAAAVVVEPISEAVEPVAAPVESVTSVADETEAPELEFGFYTDSNGLFWQFTSEGWNRPDVTYAPEGSPSTAVTQLSNAEAAARLQAIEPMDGVEP